MHNSIIQLIEAIFQMLLSIRADQQGIAQDGLGAGGTGLNNDTIRKMLMSKESKQAYEQLMGKQNAPDLAPQTKQRGASLTEADYRGWNKEVDQKMTASLKELGLDDAAIAQFKNKTNDIALQMEAIARRYTDPIERNMAMSDFINKQVKEVRDEVQRMQGKGLPKEQITETIQMGDKSRQMAGPLTGGMVEKQAMYNGVGLSQGVPVWMSDNVIDRLQNQSKEMDIEHTAQLEAKERINQAANESRMVKDLREGMSKGTSSADELVRRSTQLYDMGDQSLLVQLGIEKQYQDYKVAKLLNNSPKMWQLYQDMGKQAAEYLKKVQGQGLDIMGQQMTVQQTQGVSMGMHF